jgi:hypothetical protein
MNVTAVAALTLRTRSAVRGTITRVTTSRRPWVHTDVELTDQTGAVVLLFMGRSGVPGVVEGRRLRAEGTPLLQRGRLVMLNPSYAFEAEG